MGAGAAPAQLQRQGPANAWKKLYKCLKAEEDGGSAAASQAEGGVRDDSWGGARVLREAAFFLPLGGPRLVPSLVQGLWRQTAAGFTVLKHH